jgi:2-aminoadipate transaminase
MKLKEWKEKSKDLGKIDDLVSFSNGVPDKKLTQQYSFMVKSVLRKVLGSNKGLVLNYAPPSGCVSLKEIVSEGFQLGYKPDEILVTTGSQQAIKILCEVLLNPGDVVMAKMPTYIGIEKPLKDRGVIIKDFSEEGVKKYYPKMVYLIPDFANPTGLSMSLAERQRVVLLAKKYKFVIVEDQTYRQLFFNENKLLPSVASLYRKTIVVDTVSKFIVPGLRIGWVGIKNKKILERLNLTKESIDLSTSNLDQEIVAELLNRFFKDKRILDKGRRIYCKKMGILVDCLNSELSDYFEWEVPDGGYYIWLKPKGKLDINKYWESCLKRKVSFSPGFLFYLDGRKSNEFRLSIGEVDEGKIKLGVERLKQSLSN